MTDQDNAVHGTSWNRFFSLSPDHRRLLQVLEAIERIERYTVRGKDVFEADELIQVWVLHHLEIMAHAIQKISKPIIRKYDHPSWYVIVGLPHIATEEYFRIELGGIWLVVEEDLPMLRQRVEEILRAEGVHTVS